MKASREILLLRLALTGQLPILRDRTFVYQAANSASGLLVTFNVYRADGTEDESQEGIAQEVGVTGRYVGRLTTDRPGWFVLIHDSAGGEGVKQFDN